MSIETMIPHSDIDLFSDKVKEEPYGHYRELRDLAPAVYLDRLDMWGLPRYAEVRAALRDWRTFASTEGVVFNEPSNEQIRGTVLASDPPVHDANRAIIAERLTPVA